MTSKKEILPIGLIESRIYTVRGQRVMLDSDLAEVYGTTTKRLNEQVKRNEDRFPKEFTFRLSKSEWAVLRSQIATSSSGRGGRRYPPRAFTEHGAIMASNVLNSDRAIRVSVHVVRAFIKQRQMLDDQVHIVPVHPHVRGEGSIASLVGIVVSGSPPRAWGRPFLLCPRHRPIRFTPTCVGKALTGWNFTCGTSVHPHVRGEG